MWRRSRPVGDRLPGQAAAGTFIVSQRVSLGRRARQPPLAFRSHAHRGRVRLPQNRTLAKRQFKS